MSARISIGLDIGGTSIKAVRVTGDDYEPITRPAGGTLDRATLLAAVAEVVQSLARGDQVARVGVAIGGMVRADGVMPADATNLPALAEMPLPALFSHHLGLPCTVLNDAQAAMHGEAWRGAARGLADVLMVTLGTGIGGGLMLGGRVRAGARGHAGEIGAFPFAGDRTFEAIASPANFEHRTGRRLGDAIAATPADADVCATLDTIGRGLAMAHLLLDLEAIVIGGSIAAVGAPLRVGIETAVRRHCPAPLRHGLTIVTSALGAYAGALGAVAPTVVGAEA